MSVHRAVFGDVGRPGTGMPAYEKLAFLQNDTDLSSIDEDSEQLACNGCHRVLVFEYPDKMNMNSWLQHKVVCKAIQ